MFLQYLAQRDLISPGATGTIVTQIKITTGLCAVVSIVHVSVWMIRPIGVELKAPSKNSKFVFYVGGYHLLIHASHFSQQYTFKGPESLQVP